MNKAEFRALLKVSFVIAVLIFFTAILYDFSVRMFYSSTNSLVQIGSGFFAVIAMTPVIMFLLWWVPDTRKAVLRMFGVDEEEPQNKKTS
jgi:Na+/proline symporter